MNIKKLSIALVAAGAVTLVLAGCTPTANQDRTVGGGKLPDSLYDTQLVELYRNADNIPNVAYFCAGKFGWAATLSNDSTSAPTLIRFPDYDKRCADLPDQKKIPMTELKKEDSDSE